MNITNATDLLHNIYSCYPNKSNPLSQISELAELAPKEGDSVIYEACEASLWFHGFK